MSTSTRDMIALLLAIHQKSVSDGPWPKSKVPERRRKEYEKWKVSLPTAQGQTWPETDDYDLPGAFLAGAWPTLEDDGYYHLGSADPRTGLILKKPGTRSYELAAEEEKRLGNVMVKMPNGREYTIPKELVDGDYIKGWF